MHKISTRFAFAVNHTGCFEAKHFGDADKFVIGEWIDNEFVLLKEEINRTKTMNEEQTHGSQKKGKAIIKLLKGANIEVLVSKQFGKNIQMVNRHFIQVIVSAKLPDEVIPMLKKYIRWFEEELVNNPEKHTLFSLKDGELRTIDLKD